MLPDAFVAAQLWAAHAAISCCTVSWHKGSTDRTSRYNTDALDVAWMHVAKTLPGLLVWAVPVRLHRGGAWLAWEGEHNPFGTGRDAKRRPS